MDPPRSRLALRLIATERLVRGLFLVGAGVYLLVHLGSDFGRIAESGRLNGGIEILGPPPF